MTVTTRCFARATCPQWYRFASTSSKVPRRPYKPTAARTKPQLPSPPLHSEAKSSETLLSLWRRSWLPLSGAALAAGFLGFYIVGTFTASCKTTGCRRSGNNGQGSAPPRCYCGGGGGGENAIPTGRPAVLDAAQFDKELDMSEWWTGITSMRKQLAARANGHVLELAVGTGRNLKYYQWDTASATTGRRRKKKDSGIMSFTGVDISEDMLQVARERLAETAPSALQQSADPTLEHTAAPAAPAAPAGGGGASMGQEEGQAPAIAASLANNGRVRLIASDAHNKLPPAPVSSMTTASASASASSYDTIVQTFGLCSVSDPVAVLCNLASAVKPDTGRIILLEHGKGWYGVVNRLLDLNAEKHFQRYGCWWNRDIEALVEEAVRKTPRLEIVEMYSPKILQLGTLTWVELRVRSSGGERSG